MKKTFIKRVATLCAVLLTMTSFVGCKGEDILLNTYMGILDFHTAEQSEYWEDYMSVALFAQGEAELSRPLPIVLEWTDKTPTDSYTVTVSEYADMTNARTFTVSESKVSIYNLKVATTYYWQVTEGEDKSAIGTFKTVENGPRNIYMDGVTNVRDVGGWMTESGKRMKQGLLYRGGRLNVSDPDGNSYATISKYIRQITDEGAHVFEYELGIKADVDFRLLNRNGFPEGMEPISPVSENIEYVSLPLNGSKAFTESTENIKAFMEYIADESHYPVYYHCNIGTDRTGMISYLLQALCGVDEYTLMADYFFSNFGNIGELKNPFASTNELKNTYVEALKEGGMYEGNTLTERVESYFRSIGVTEETYSAVRDILMGA